jgi:hypothetical protein
MIMKTWSVIIASLILWTGVALSQNTNVTVTVNGTSGPWLWVNGGLNTAYPYSPVGPGDPGYPQAPTVISASSGFRFSIGDSLTISYLSGLVSYGGNGTPHVDANGDTNSPLNNTTFDGGGPSFYMSPYPIYTAELVGTFANSSGQIVGTPFAIGDLGTFTVPTGATQLQLGVNDNWYGDNSGSWAIHVVGAAIVPEPSTTLLVIIGFAGLGLLAYRPQARHFQ